MFCYVLLCFVVFICVCFWCPMENRHFFPTKSRWMRPSNVACIAWCDATSPERGKVRCCFPRWKADVAQSFLFCFVTKVGFVIPHLSNPTRFSEINPTFGKHKFWVAQFVFSHLFPQFFPKTPGGFSSFQTAGARRLRWPSSAWTQHFRAAKGATCTPRRRSRSPGDLYKMNLDDMINYIWLNYIELHTILYIYISMWSPPPRPPCMLLIL